VDDSGLRATVNGRYIAVGTHCPTGLDSAEPSSACDNQYVVTVQVSDWARLMVCSPVCVQGGPSNIWTNITYRRGFSTLTEMSGDDDDTVINLEAAVFLYDTGANGDYKVTISSTTTNKRAHVDFFAAWDPAVHPLNHVFVSTTARARDETLHRRINVLRREFGLASHVHYVDTEMPANYGVGSSATGVADQPMHTHIANKMVSTIVHGSSRGTEYVVEMH